MIVKKIFSGGVLARIQKGVVVAASKVQYSSLPASNECWQYLRKIRRAKSHDFESVNGGAKQVTNSNFSSRKHASTG